MTQVEQIYTSITGHDPYIRGESLITRRAYISRSNVNNSILCPAVFFSCRYFNDDRRKALSISINYSSVKYLGVINTTFFFIG